MKNAFDTIFKPQEDKDASAVTAFVRARLMSVALVLAITAVIATFFVDEVAAGWTAVVFCVALAYFWFYSRHHLVANAPEEEFAAIQQAESELH